MLVSVTGAVAGALSSSIAVVVSARGRCSASATVLARWQGMGSDNYGVSGLIEAAGNVIDAASPLINTAQPIQLGNVRINTASPQALVSVTNQATGNSQAALNASISGNAAITASGSFNLLAPGATNSSNLQVGMQTSAAGAISGTASIAFVSDANNIGNCAPNCQMSLAAQDVSVQGAVYRLADPTLHTNSVNLLARRGDAAPTAAISVSNQSPDAFTEGLKASVTSTPVGFSGSGNLANLVAGGTDAGSLQVALNTSTAGSFAGNA